MSSYMQHELIFFLHSFAAGVILTAGYDILRIFRNVAVHNSFFVAVEDLFYGCIAGIFLFAVIYGENDGIVRVYALLSIGIGSALYHFGPSKWITKFMTAVLRAILKKILKFKWDRVIVILTGKKSTGMIRKQVYGNNKKQKQKKIKQKEYEKDKSAE